MRRFFFIINMVSCLVSFSGMVYAAPASHLYTTGQTMEVDRCASAWLIKRFVDKEAVFAWYPENSLITDGIVFDRPEGNLQRTHSQSTFEVILDRYKITNPSLKKFGALLHDIEINFWGKRDSPISRKLEADVGKLISNGQKNAHCDEVCFQYFDQFFKTFARAPQE